MKNIYLGKSCGPSLDAQQYAAATAPAGPLMILAGAGTGKTTTISARIAYSIKKSRVLDSHILAVTFTTKAANQLREHIASTGLGSISSLTFHSAAFRQLKYFSSLHDPQIQWKLTSNKFPLLSRICLDYKVKSYDIINSLIAEIDWAKSMRISPQDYASNIVSHHRISPVSPEMMAEIYMHYDEVKKHTNELDFHDLITQLCNLYTLRPDLLDIFRERYRSFVIDEYQDVNPLQQHLLDLWLGDRDDITVVGDANQTIYSFTGASSQFLLDFPRRFPDAHIFRLVHDYRSTSPIVDIANTIISGLSYRPAGTRLTLIGQQKGGTLPTYTSYSHDDSETTGVVGQCYKLISSGTPAEEIAILYRNNIMSTRFEYALYTYGLPYRIHAAGNLYSHSHIRKIIELLRKVAKDSPDLQGKNLEEKIDQVFALSGYTRTPPGEDAQYAQWELLNNFYAHIEKFYRDSNKTVKSFITSLNKCVNNRQESPIGSIVLSSLHAAKGLEWDAVFIVGLHEGNIPTQKAIDSTDSRSVDEERRLLYVGVTRAKRQLYLSWALRRNEKSQLRKPSRFLQELPNL